MTTATGPSTPRSGRETASAATDATDPHGVSRTATILVCPLSRVNEIATRYGVTRVLSLIGDPEMATTPDCVTDHLVLHVHDILTGNDTQILAQAGHIQQIIDFAGDWDGRHPMLVHCLAGISRSTASAFIAACALQPDRDEAEIATALRRASATATPNRHFVALADQILGRDGRMVAAVEVIGAGEPAPEGTPFALTITLARR